MPFFHLAIDLIERDWMTIEAPSAMIAYEWARKRAAKVYKNNGSVYTDIEFGGDVERVPPEDEDAYEIEMRLDGEGKEIEKA